MGLLAAGALTACLILALDEAMATWLAALLVGLAYAVVAGALERSPLSDLLELETLLVGITGKQALWHSLRASTSASSEDLDRLVERADSQKTIVEDARLRAVRRAFSSERED